MPMSVSRIRLATLAATALFGGAVAASPPASAVDMENPSVRAVTAPAKPAAPAVKKKKHSSGQARNQKRPKTEGKRSQRQFIDGYHVAHALIYRKGDYAAAIPALRALHHNENPDVDTLLGYASRKVGRYGDAKYWYDGALAADPHHASALS